MLMAMTKLQEKARVKYVTPKQFMEQYSLSKSQAYKILSRPEMQEAKIKTGEKQIRINLDRAFEIMQQIYSQKGEKQMKNIVRGIIFWIIALAFIFVMFLVAEALSKIVTINFIMNLVYVLLAISILYILNNIQEGSEKDV